MRTHVLPTQPSPTATILMGIGSDIIEYNIKYDDNIHISMKKRIDKLTLILLS